MITVDLKHYAPCITNSNVAEDIFNQIMKSNPSENEIIIDMNGIITISIPCINIIFGGLYSCLGADLFHEHIVLDGCSDMLGDFMAFVLNKRFNNSDSDSDYGE